MTGKHFDGIKLVRTAQRECMTLGSENIHVARSVNKSQLSVNMTQKY